MNQCNETTDTNTIQGVNPFESDNNMTQDVSVDNNYKIEIWVEHKGRKCITFISGWNIEDMLLTEHVKFIKKKNACNGSFKTITESNKTFKLIQFQGDHVQFMSAFLKDKGVMEEFIKIKGTIF